MRKSFSLFAISILGILDLIISFITLTAFKPLHHHNYIVNKQTKSEWMKLILLIQRFYAVVFLKIDHKKITLLTLL